MPPAVALAIRLIHASVKGDRVIVDRRSTDANLLRHRRVHHERNEHDGPTRFTGVDIRA